MTGPQTQEDLRKSPIPVSPERPLRIVLLSPKGPLYRHRGGIFGQGVRYMPLTLPTLAALIPPELPHTVNCYDEGIEDIPIDTLQADVVGITVITGTAPRAYGLAAKLRARGIIVVMGGPHLHRAHHQHPQTPWIGLPQLVDNSGRSRPSWLSQWCHMWRGPRPAWGTSPKPELECDNEST